MYNILHCLLTISALSYGTVSGHLNNISVPLLACMRINTVLLCVIQGLHHRLRTGPAVHPLLHILVFSTLYHTQFHSERAVNELINWIRCVLGGGWGRKLNGSELKKKKKKNLSTTGLAVELLMYHMVALTGFQPTTAN